MTTFVNYLAVLAIAALLLGPSLYGILRDRRIDQQLRAVATRLVWLPASVRAASRPPRAGVRSGPPPGGTGAPSPTEHRGTREAGTRKLPHPGSPVTPWNSLTHATY